MREKICPDKVAQQFSEYWSPRIAGKLNDHHIKFAKFKGEYIWHKHEQTDEAFLVISGSMKLQYRDREILLGAGELIVVPKNTEHRPSAEEECFVMIIEKADTVSTGTEHGGKFQSTAGEWL